MNESSGSGRLVVVTILAVVAGVALAIVIQQAGVWPLDRLMLFGLPGLMALIGLGLVKAGGFRPRKVVTVIVLVIVIALLAFAGTGLAAAGQQGQLNGGCTVTADSGIDSTSVTDTSRSNPFDVDPDGGITWQASSPAPIKNHMWEIWVDVGGFQVVVANGGDPNEGESTSNAGSEDVGTYKEFLEERTGVEIVGIYQVGGFIRGDGGACDGFGFVRVQGGFLQGPIALAAAIIFVVLVVIIIVITMKGRRERTEVRRIEV